jgi:hypothetical protein
MIWNLLKILEESCSIKTEKSKNILIMGPLTEQKNAKFQNISASSNGNKKIDQHKPI